jgi:uroporphyrinogen-III synthase
VFDKAVNSLVLLTRPEGRNEALAARLQGCGLSSLALPALSIQPIAVRSAVWPWPDEYDLIVFVSGNAARFYLDQLARLRPGAAWPAGTLLATVGLASARPLYDAGFIPPANILHPSSGASRQDSESLWELLQPRARQFQRVLVVRGETGREWLGRQLEQAGAQVRRYAIYRRMPVRWLAGQARMLESGLESGRPVICLLTSAESVAAVHANVVRCGLDRFWAQAGFVAVHERVADHLRSLIAPISGKVDAPRVVICSPGDEAVFQAIVSIASL